MRARFRALLLSTAMLFAATSYASAAFDGDCFPELAAAPKAVMVADTVPAEAAPEMSLRGTVGPVTDASDAPAEMPALVASADVVVPLPDDLGSEVAQALATWAAPVAEAGITEAGLAATADEPEATGSLVATAAPSEEPSESIAVQALTLE